MTSIPKIEYFWKEVGFKPTKSQEEAILHSGSPLLLTAGPGSGKTRVLLWRTLNLIVYEDINPEEIFLSTFTEKAAFQLKEGLRSLLSIVSNKTGKPYDISKMAIGTVHSICNTIIGNKKFSADGTRRHAPIVMDELDQYLFIYNRYNWIELIGECGFNDEEDAQRQINNFLSHNNWSSRHLAVVNLISLFNRFSEEYLDLAALYLNGDEMLNNCIKMYQKYLSMLKKQNTRIPTVDLSLLQTEAYKTITSFTNGKSVYKHVIIDEYQDTNTIQEKIFFALAKNTKNICVVGDDDQALYRFRGATVENLVEFEDRCKKYLGLKPHRIDLVKNFRSKKAIVETYNHFIRLIDWKKEGKKKGHYRIHDKVIEPHSNDKDVSVVLTKNEKPAEVGIQLADFIKELKSKGKINDYNEVAFLFPAMKGNAKVRDLKAALESRNIPVYAPRAGRFLESEEAAVMFALIANILGKPPFNTHASGSMKGFQGWLSGCISNVKENIIKKDKQLEAFIDEKKTELEAIVKDYELIQKLLKKKGWEEDADATLEKVAEMAKLPGLSIAAQKALNRQAFRNLIKKRLEDKNAFKLKYVINRVTSVDWTVLDLFYRLCGFRYYKDMFDLAEDGRDEGPVCNLSLISSYIARFTEKFPPVITARLYRESGYVKLLFNSYLYALYRLQESEYEYEDDPFPKGRVPFLSIHQAKGLEFPYVVLGSAYKRDWEASETEKIIRQLVEKDIEPIEKISKFDNMRMFYVALSRAKHLLVLPNYKGAAAATAEFKELYENIKFPELESLDIKKLPKAEPEKEELGKNYSFTGDYLSYRNCPRQYMVFRKYGFVPSRSQTMFFGSLVHRTIEELHNFLIHEHLKTPTLL